MTMADVKFPIDGVAYLSPAQSARYRAAGAWVESSAGDALRSTARRLPQKWALISREHRLSYAEFDAASERLGAALLGLGLAPGDRALFQMGTVIETAIALFACFKAGVVPVCSLPQYREIEMGELARRSEAKAWFVQADFSAFETVSRSRISVRKRAPFRPSGISSASSGSISCAPASIASASASRLGSAWVASTTPR